MAYRSKQFGLVLDKSYPSEIAKQRPVLAARIHCEAETSSLDMEPSPDHDEFEGAQSPSQSIRGDRKAPSMCDEFNRALRAGHGFRNEGKDKE